MTEAAIKESINQRSRQSSLPDAPEVYVRHCNEQVDIKDRSPWGGTCFLIHPDITLKEFFE